MQTIQIFIQKSTTITVFVNNSWKRSFEKVSECWSKSTASPSPCRWRSTGSRSSTWSPRSPSRSPRAPSQAAGWRSSSMSPTATGPGPGASRADSTLTRWDAWLLIRYLLGKNQVNPTLKIPPMRVSGVSWTMQWMDCTDCCRFIILDHICPDGLRACCPLLPSLWRRRPG